MTEADRLAQLLAKCPSLAKAFTGTQVTFDDQAEPTDDDLHFITRVEGAPVKIQGRLGPDGVWRITAYHIAIPPEHEEAAEAAIAGRNSWSLSMASARRWLGTPFRACWGR